ncbi:MAG: hypothetical protein DRN91_07885, partial [Candidatus Alkanophagales archaeon]
MAVEEIAYSLFSIAGRVYRDCDLGTDTIIRGAYWTSQALNIAGERDIPVMPHSLEVDGSELLRLVRDELLCELFM